MQKPMTVELVVAADFKPDLAAGQNFSWVRRRVLRLADQLADLGVYLKLGSALRVCGYDLVREVHERGLGVFADLKLYDIKNTLETDGAFLSIVQPDIVTVASFSSFGAIDGLKKQLPETAILGTTVLSDANTTDITKLFGDWRETVIKTAERAQIFGLEGVVLSAQEIGAIRTRFGNKLTLNVTAVRPSWIDDIPDDDQNRRLIRTPAEAVKAGANRLIIGRPIVSSPDPREVTERILNEMESALETVASI